MADAIQRSRIPGGRHASALVSASGHTTWECTPALEQEPSNGRRSPDWAISAIQIADIQGRYCRSVIQVYTKVLIYTFSTSIAQNNFILHKLKITSSESRREKRSTRS